MGDQVEPVQLELPFEFEEHVMRPLPPVDFDAALRASTKLLYELPIDEQK